MFGTGSADGTIDLMLNETYVMTGGTGTTTVAFKFNGITTTASEGCSFTFNGTTIPGCLPPAETYTETVEYGTPFTVGLSLQIIANSTDGNPIRGNFSYDFNNAGLQVAPTPEPSSILLLMPGLAGVMFAAKSRLRTRLG